MLTIRYKLPNYTEPQFLTFEGRLFADKNIDSEITTDWKNESIDVQHIYSNGYRMECNIKESEFVALQKLKYAYEIYILINESYILFEFVDFSSDEIFGEFKKATILFTKVSEKEFSNVILNKPVVDGLTIYDSDTKPNTLLFSSNLFLNPVKNSNFTKNNIDDFSQQIDDYYRNQIYFDVRIFLNESDYFDFLTALQNSNYLRLTSETTNFEYTILRNEFLGNDLYLIELNLIESTTITEIQ